MAVVGGLVVFDQLTKFLAAGSVVHNPGVSFGMQIGTAEGIVVVSGLILIALVGYRLSKWWPVTSDETYAVWWMLLVAGGTSNLIDRILWGGVQDWLHVPVLGLTNNLADWYITLAVMVLIGKMVWQFRT